MNHAFPTKKAGMTAVAVALASLAACTLPGRNTFAPKPVLPAPQAVAGIEDEAGRVPLVTIPTPVSAPDYAAALSGAVRAAEAQKPDVVFDVVAFVPRKGTPDRQTDAAKALTPQSAEVAQAILGEGVPVSRVTLGAMIGAPKDLEAVRVYVR